MQMLVDLLSDNYGDEPHRVSFKDIVAKLQEVEADDHVFTTVVVVDLASWRLLVHPHLHPPRAWVSTETFGLQVRELLTIV